MSNPFDLKAKTWDQERYRIERARMIAHQIGAIVTMDHLSTVLDFGCGTGLLGFNFVDQVQEITFADTSAGMLQQVEEKIKQGNHANATVLDLARQKLTRTYSVIISLLVLHHIQDYPSAVVELIHALDSGGYLCLCDLEQEDGTFHNGELVPHHGFDRQEIESIYRQNNLEVINSSTVFINHKVVNHEDKEYPIFMIIGKRT